ncbi:hypothetical protein [Marinobacterium aestuariivivens]|uniref:Amidohydrolase 3 domain-containing protein n=1 Tax=Marinobacterium aestuariivivens TaxID=1698799 RepID=A0ABW1ZTF0_9GAMM
MTETLWLRNVRPRGGDAEDIRIADGCIAERRPAAAGDRDGGWIDGRGRLLLPALVESHAHLDKTLWGQPWRSNSAGPTLKDYIDNERRVLAGVEAPILTRAGDLLEQYIRRGTLALRSHVDVAPDIGLSHVEGMLALRELYAPGSTCSSSPFRRWAC